MIVAREPPESGLESFHSHPLYFRPQGNQACRKNMIWDDLSTHLAPKIGSYYQFRTWVSDCETTCMILVKWAALRKLTTAAFTKESTLNEITVAGAEMALYKPKCTTIHAFLLKVAISLINVQVESLPPTATVACCHSARRYFQVQQWVDKVAVQARTQGGVHWVHVHPPPPHLEKMFRS